MPGRDGMGPMGQGPATGGGRGRCGGGAGRTGGGMGRGGWRHRNQYHATGLTGWQRAGSPGAEVAPAPSREQELAALRQQAEGLTQALDEIRVRIAALDPAGEEQG